jgi:hypothetical protein
MLMCWCADVLMCLSPPQSRRAPMCRCADVLMCRCVTLLNFRDAESRRMKLSMRWDLYIRHYVYFVRSARMAVVVTSQCPRLFDNIRFTDIPRSSLCLHTFDLPMIVKAPYKYNSNAPLEGMLFSVASYRSVHPYFHTTPQPWYDLNEWPSTYTKKLFTDYLIPDTFFVIVSLLHERSFVPNSQTWLISLLRLE